MMHLRNGDTENYSSTLLYTHHVKIC